MSPVVVGRQEDVCCSEKLSKLEDVESWQTAAHGTDNGTGYDIDGDCGLTTKSRFDGFTADAVSRGYRATHHTVITLKQIALMFIIRAISQSTSSPKACHQSQSNDGIVGAPFHFQWLSDESCDDSNEEDDI